MNSSPGSPARPRRACSSVSGWSGPSDAVPTSTGVPSALWASTSAAVGPAVVIDACTVSPSTTIVWKWQLRQPRSNHAAPHSAVGQRIELAEVGRSLDRRAGQPERRRGGARRARWRGRRSACSSSICAGARNGPVTRERRVEGVHPAHITVAVDELELRRHLRGRRRRRARPPVPGPRRPGRHVGRARPPRRRAGRRSRGRRSRTPGEGRLLPPQRPEYMEAMVATFKAAMVPVNTNFRYGPDEIRYLFDNADVEAVVFHARFAELLDGIRGDLPMVRRWYVVADDTGAGPDWATSYEDVVTSGAARPAVAQRRRPLAALHRRHHRHPEGRDVAPGRPLQRARRRRQPAAGHAAGRVGRRGRGERGRGDRRRP